MIALRKNHPAQPEVVEHLEHLLGRARQGLITGVLCICGTVSGPDELGLCGDFAEDLDYASRAASQGFAAMLGYKFEVAQPRRGLPRDLKGSV